LQGGKRYPWLLSEQNRIGGEVLDAIERVDHVLGPKDDVLGGLRKPYLHPHERMNRVLDVLLLTPVRHVRNTSRLGQHDENGGRKK
jgi:hypothetical protein